MTLVPAIIAAVSAWLVLSLLLRYTAVLPADVPNERSLHARAVPRGAGIAVFAGWLAGTIWMATAKPWLGPLAVLIAVSLWDDRRGVPVALRLLVQVAAAGWWLWATAFPINPVLAIAAIVWMANLYNFMDGSDGLAGVMTVTGFGAYAVAAWQVGSADAALLLALVAAAIPFLASNLPPARAFLGDVGAVPLGFLAAVFGLAGWQAGHWPAWFPVMVFLPFIADATVTLMRRLLQGARIWEAHRDHYYQRLVQLGWGHGGALALYAALMIATAGSALAALAWQPAAGGATLIVAIAVIAVIFGAIDYHWRRQIKELNEGKG